MDRVEHTTLGSDVLDDVSVFSSTVGDDLADKVRVLGTQDDGIHSDDLLDVTDRFETDIVIGDASAELDDASEPDDVSVFASPDADALPEKLDVLSDPDDGMLGDALLDVTARFETDIAIVHAAPEGAAALDMAMGDMDMTSDEMDHVDHNMTEDLVIEDNNAFLMAMGEGSRIEIHAADASKESWTQLSQNARAGDTVLSFTEDTGWEVGDKIAIAASGHDYTEDEERTIIGISSDGKTVTLDKPLEFDHYGVLETYSNGSETWQVDMRAEVALLTRNVTIQGDENSIFDGFGAHTMVMNGAEQHISGAEFFRVGQEDILGRYPIHWHMLGDASGQYVTNVSVHNSYQKGSTVHGTSNILYANNVIFDHVGHGFFMEDGSETGNVVKYNLVFGSHASNTGQPIPTDQTDVSSYWIENVSNTFIGNHAAGSEHVGFFIAPATETGPHGLSEGMLVPNNANDFYFVGNTASSNEFGVFLDGHIDGETLEHVDGQNFSLDGSLWFVDTTAYANSEVGLWSFKGNGSDNYVVILDAKLADNASNLEVRGDDLLFLNSVSIGESGNIAADKNLGNIGVKTYRNSDAAMVDVHFANFNNHSGDTAISLQEAELKDYGDNFQGISFTNVNNEMVFRDITALLRPDDAFTTVARDDGSLTGVNGGAWITRNVPGEPQRTGYNSYADPSLDNAWITTEGAMGVTEFYLFGKGADNEKMMTVTRSVDSLKFEIDSWLTRPGGGGEDLYQFVTPTADDQEAAFLVELGGPDNVFPTNFNLSLDGIRVGEAVVYEIPNVASFSPGFAVDTVNSMNALFAADSTAAFIQGGSLFIRVVGMRATNESYLGSDPDDQLFGEFMGTESPGGYAISFNVTPLTAGNSNFQRYGEATFDRGLLNALGRTDGFVSTEPANSELLLDDAPTAHEEHDSTSDTIVVTAQMPRWSDVDAWGGVEPGTQNIIVVGAGQTIVIDQSATVKGIIVDGGNFIVEDAPGGAANAIKLVSDYVLVINGGLFQAGTETNPLDRDFTLELTGDDPDFDLYVTDVLNGLVPNTLFAQDVDDEPAPPAEVWGTLGDDELDGTGADETFFAQDGNDTILGNNGNDTIHTGEGDDTAFGGNGNDVAHGFIGNDTVYGGNGSDFVTGGFGADEVYGDAGIDEVYGDDGRDTVYGGGGNDKVGGDNHDDVLYGGAGDDELWGGPEDSGNDTLIGGAGADLLGGGAGNDVYLFEALTDSTAASTDRIVDFVPGEDLIDVSALGITGMNQLTITQVANQTTVSHNSSAFQFEIQGRHTLQASNFVFAPIAPPEDNEIFGTAGDDTLQGTNNDDTLYGFAGNDVLRGTNGDDVAYGGIGEDNLQGGNGNDILHAGDGDDYLAGSYDDDFVTGGAGDDEVYGDYGIDTLYGNDGDDKVGGGDDDDYLYGGNGDDNLIGGIGEDSGNDTLYGGAGADSLNGGAGNDVYVFNTVEDSTAASRDTIQQFSAADDVLDVSALEITGIHQLTITVTANQTLVRHNTSNFEVLIQGQHTLQASNFTFAEADETVDARLELGTVTVPAGISEWHSVSFETAIVDAVVVMGPISFNGNSASVMRVRNVTENGFEMQLDEWNYLNEFHQAETVSWMAVSAGSHRLADGSLIQAGYTSVSDEVPASVTFADSFADAPIVFGQVTTYNGNSTVTDRLSNISETGLEIRMQEQEAADNLHAVETASWIAFDGDTTAFDRAGSVDVDHEWAKVKTGEAPASDDVLIADLQSFNGGDPVAMRFQDTPKGVVLLAQEESSEDDEVTHAVETAGFLMAQAGQYDLIA